MTGVAANKTLLLPTATGPLQTQTPKLIGHRGKVVLLGANGSGKSRLGAWVEDHLAFDCVRVTAAKSLEIPEVLPLLGEDIALRKFETGYQDLGDNIRTTHHRASSKYNHRPTTKTVNDYDSVLQLLFARHQSAANEALERVRAGESMHPTSVATTALEKLKRIWNELLPHRILDTVQVGVLKCKVPSQDEGKIYSAGDMSDGERAMVYLLAKILLAPSAGTIIIDEPEIHLHPALRDAFWSAIEKECPNATFVYITHDISFVAERFDATVVWVKAFNGKEWTYEIVESQNEVPAELQLTLLGSRKPILFVEGEHASWDYKLYSCLYPQCFVWPCGNSSAVIAHVRAINKANFLHNAQASGIVDRDRRTQGDIDTLERERVFVTDVCEVENLFWTPEVLRVVAELQKLSVEQAQEQATDFIVERLRAEMDTQVALQVKAHFESATIPLSKANDLAAIDAAHAAFSAKSPSEIAAVARAMLEAALASRDLCKIAQVYRRESLSWEIGKVFGFHTTSAEKYLPNFVVRALRSDGSAKQVRDALMAYLPTLG